MTKKHFQALADAMKANKPYSTIAAPSSPAGKLQAIRIEQWQKDCEAVALACAGDNGRFDRSQFLVACGFDLSEV